MVAKTDYRVSTIVVTANWGTTVNLDNLVESLRKVIIPFWYPDNGIIKMEHKQIIYGICDKDIFTNRKISQKGFANHSSIIIRKKIDESQPDSPWKECNIKLSDSGSIQLTGVPSEQFARESIELLLDIIKTLPESPFQSKPSIERLQLCNINTDYELLNVCINQDALHKILLNTYNLCSSLEKTIYQGINAKYYYNTHNTTDGICGCKNICEGDGMGDGEGQCKKITMCIFRTGKIIITGGRILKHIDTVYNYLNSIFERHEKAVLIPASKLAEIGDIE